MHGIDVHLHSMGKYTSGTIRAMRLQLEARKMEVGLTRRWANAGYAWAVAAEKVLTRDLEVLQGRILMAESHVEIARSAL